MPKGRCCECADGEHENFDEDVRLTIVRDPEINSVCIKVGWMCSEHRDMYEIDGYDLTVR